MNELGTAESVDIAVGSGSVSVSRSSSASHAVTGTWDITYDGVTLRGKEYLLLGVSEKSVILYDYYQ